MAVRREPKHHVDVAKTEVGVDHTHAVAETRQREPEVHGHAGLAHTTLAAGDSNNGGERCLSGGRAHATAPAISPTTQSARMGAVARCKSAGTFCPVPKYESGRPLSRSTAASGPIESTSSRRV